MFFFLSAKSGAFLWLCFWLKDSLVFSFFLSLFLSLSFSLSLVASFFLFRVVCSVHGHQQDQKLKKKCFSVCANIGIFSQLFLSLSQTQQLEHAVCALVVLRVILTLIVIVI